MLKILGTGSYLPEKVVTNDDLSKVYNLDTNDEWIYSHSGIHSRHIAEGTDATASMATKAGKAALESAGVDPKDIALIIVATVSPEYHALPSTACIVQNALGCTNAYAFDLMAACSGFVFGLEQARGYLTLHPDKKALVIGAECLSRICDWTDRGTCILFGDGAGAVVVGKAPEGEGEGLKTYSFLRSDGSGADMMGRKGGTHDPITPGEKKDVTWLYMNGRGVFQFAIKTVPMVIEELCKEAGIQVSDIDLIVPHQANMRILDSSAKRLGYPLEKFYSNIETTGNTSGASIPIALDAAVKSGAVKEGMTISFVGFGAGLTYGGMLMTYPYL